MKRTVILMILIIILCASCISVTAADDTPAGPVTAASSGSMYIISGSTAPQYASSYEDVYGALMTRYIDNYDTSFQTLSHDSVLDIAAVSYQGPRALAVTPSSADSSTLTLNLSSYDLTGYKYLMFAVNIPAGMYKLRTEITSLPYMVGSDLTVASYSSESMAPGGYGWQIVLCDISRFSGASAPMELKIILSHASVSAQDLPVWYVDGIGLTADSGAARVLRYLSSEYYAVGGRVYTDLNSIRLNVASQNPYIESAAISPFSFRNADAVEIKFTSTEPVSAVRVYYTDSTSPMFDMSRSIYKETSSDGEYRVMTFEIGTASQLRIEFEGISSGTVTVYSIRPVNTGLGDYGRLGVISSCELGDSRRFTVRGQLSSETAEQFRHLKLGLYELRSPSDIELMSTGGLTPIAAVRVSESFSLTASLYDGERSMLCSAFAVGMILGGGSTAAPVGVPVYITNPEMLRSSSWSYTEAAVKKGRSPDGLTDESAVLDGVKHTILDVELTSLSSDEDNGIAHTYNETLYYFDREAVNALDARISELYLASVNVRLRLICEPAEGRYSPLYSDRYCTLNVSTREARELFAASVDFLASRYSDSDRTYGRVVGYILGRNRTDAEPAYHAPAYYDTAAAASDYASALRIMYNTVGVHGDARIYMWMDGGWETGSGMTMNNRALLESLSGITKQGGDFCWGIALDPYPHTEGIYCSWLDNTLSNDYDAVSLTARNITLLCDFLARDSMLCSDGDVRNIILYDDNPPSELAPMEDMINAAEFVLTYYKLNTRECAAVECFVTGGLPSYEEIFRNIDTDLTRTASEFALNIIGTSDWRELFDGYDETLIVRRNVVSAEFSDGASLPESKYTLFSGTENELPITQFTASSGLSALKYIRDTESDSGYGTKLIDGAAMMARLDGSGSAVIGAQTSYPLDLSAAGLLGFRVQVSSLPQDVSSASLTVLLYSGDSRLQASGIIREGGWNDIALDVSPFTSTGRRIDRIRFIIGSSDTENGGEYDLGEAIVYISPISVHSDTLSDFELSDLFKAQYDSYFTESVREYNMKLIIGLCAVGGIAALLFVIRRIAPGKGKRDEEDFTDMEMWR